MLKNAIVVGLFIKFITSVYSSERNVYPNIPTCEGCRRDATGDEGLIFASPEKIECGWANPEGSPEEDMRVNREFPWIVSVVKNLKVEYKVRKWESIDVGILIHPGVVVTTAKLPHQDMPLGIVAGESSKHEQYREIASVVFHEKYERGNLNYNIALLFLKETFNLSTHVTLACLPPDSRVPARTDCVAINKKTSTDIKRRIKLDKVPGVSLVDNTNCRAILDKSMANVTYTTYDTILCARAEATEPDEEYSSESEESEESEDSPDPCSPDQDNMKRLAIFCPVQPGSKRYEVFGLSFKPWYCWRDESISSMVYLNIIHFRNWIDEKVGEGGLRDISVYECGE